MDPQVYNAISERCLSGTLASVNYDGIVEFPTPQTANSNHLIYTSGYNRDPETQSVNYNSDKKHLQSADHTVYSQNFQKQNTMLDDRPRMNHIGQQNMDQNHLTSNSIGGKVWMPGFNMTASSIKSEQSVRISKEPVMQTPVQYTNKVNNDRRSIPGSVEKNLNYTPEVHNSKPRTFGNSQNPSMTAHSMNVMSTNGNTVHQTANKAAASQNDYYHHDDSRSSNGGLGDYNMGKMRKNKPMDYRSDKSLSNVDNPIPAKGPIKPVNSGVSAKSSLHSEAMHTGFSGFDNEDAMSESRQNRYSMNSNKSLESRNRAKNSMSQKKPPLKSRKNRIEGSERALSIDAREKEDSISEKLLSPDGQWKNVLTDIQKKNDWELQFKACNTIKDFSSEHPKFFKNTDSHFGEIMSELSTL